MPLVLDEKDIAIINSMKNDARKSFRQVALETGLSEHVVTKRFDRLVNVGLIKSVSLVLDLTKIENKWTKEQIGQIELDIDPNLQSLREGAKVTVNCDYCHGTITGEPLPLEFADYQRYFCCITCRRSYSEKHKSRINSLVKKYMKEHG